MHNKLSDTQIHKLKKYFYRINKSWEQKDKNNISKYFTHFKYHLRGGEGKEDDGKGESSSAAEVSTKIVELNKIIDSIDFNKITEQVNNFKNKLENDKQKALDEVKSIATQDQSLSTNKIIQLEAEIDKIQKELNATNQQNVIKINDLQEQIKNKETELELSLIHI